MAYRIEFVEFYGGDPELIQRELGITYEQWRGQGPENWDGYEPWPYLPDFDEMTFDNRADAEAFIAERYKGADTVGVQARFKVTGP